jgi:hypothetical protein
VLVGLNLPWANGPSCNMLRALQRPAPEPAGMFGPSLEGSKRCATDLAKGARLPRDMRGGQSGERTAQRAAVSGIGGGLRARGLERCERHKGVGAPLAAP